MAISVVNSKEVLTDKTNKSLGAIVEGIDSINKAVEYIPRDAVKLADHMTRTIEGISGHTEGFKTYKVYATDMGSFDHFESNHESYETWSFGRRGYTVKTKSITKELLDLAVKEGIDLTKFSEGIIQSLADFYLNQYIPNVFYEELFRVPTFDIERNYHGQPHGFLRGDTVCDCMLRPYAKDKTSRNHYRAIKSSEGKTTKHDLLNVGEYLSQYVDIENKDIIYVMNRKEYFKLTLSVFKDSKPSKPVVNEHGYAIITVDGFKIMLNNYIDSDWIFVLNQKSKDVITKMVSPQDDKRGMAMVNEKGFAKFEDLYDLVGSEFKIMPEGYHLTGRHQGCMLYVGEHDLCTDDGNYTMPIKDGKMGEHIIGKMEKYADSLKQHWYRGLR